MLFRSEFYLMAHTYSPFDKHAIDSWKTLLLDYLQNEYSISEDELKSLQNDAARFGDYSRRPIHESQTDFRRNIAFLVGPLASMNSDLGTNSEDFFNQLSNYKISPIYDSTQTMPKSLKQKFGAKCL